MSDNLNIFGTTYSNVTGIKATNTANYGLLPEETYRYFIIYSE